MNQVDFEGWEFDWYATDGYGNFAIISTAGQGPLMPHVISNYKDHQSISEFLDSPNWGSPNVWDDYANIGLYVFDWKLNKGPYNKIRNPAKKITDQLKTEILKIKDLPEIKMDFELIEILNHD